VQLGAQVAAHARQVSLQLIHLISQGLGVRACLAGTG
jgi:hypothetical protein